MIVVNERKKDLIMRIDGTDFTRNAIGTIKRHFQDITPTQDDLGKILQVDYSLLIRENGSGSPYSKLFMYQDEDVFNNASVFVINSENFVSLICGAIGNKTGSSLLNYGNINPPLLSLRIPPNRIPEAFENVIEMLNRLNPKNLAKLEKVSSETSDYGFSYVFKALFEKFNITERMVGARERHYPKFERYSDLETL